MPEERRWPGRPSAPERLEDRLLVEPDGTVVVCSGKVDYGQGIRTGFAKIVSMEMGIPLEQVRVELGETDRVPWDIGTFGSMSTATDGKVIRAAAVQARRLLTAGKPLTGEIPELPTSGGPAADDAPLRLEAIDIVTGRGRYTADVRLPGMLHGRVLHAPGRAAQVAAFDDTAARRLPGVVEIVRDGDFVGIVAERDEQARAAVAALHVGWQAATVGPRASIDVVLRHDEGVDARLAGQVVEARYFVPHIAHASIGPSAAVADVRAGRADLYVSTHRPFAVRDDVARILGLPPEGVHVHPTLTSGTYGRGNVTDAPIEAARLSRAVGRPVLVQWSRREEFQCSPHRPTLDASARAALDARGRIAAWRYDTTTGSHAYGGEAAPQILAMTSGRNAVPPYRLACADITLHVVDSPVRTGAFRSLAGAPNVFAIESFVDELADAAEQDPISFRLAHIDDDRLRRALEAVRDASGWRGRSRDGVHGLGAACAMYHGTRVAAVAAIVIGADGRVRLDRAWCAVDPGRLVHPDGARNQIEGGMQQAASWTLLEELRTDGDRVITAGWSDYPIATFLDAPEEMTVIFAGTGEEASTGIGEVGSVPMAPAIANAVFHACGARVRRLPLTPAAVRAAREPAVR